MEAKKFINSFGENEPDPPGKHKWIVHEEYHAYFCLKCKIFTKYIILDTSSRWIWKRHLKSFPLNEDSLPLSCKEALMDDALL